MILEARLGFIILFLLIWSTIGLVPWTVSAIAVASRIPKIALDRPLELRIGLRQFDEGIAR